MNGRPRVLHVMHGLGAGGAERLVLELVTRLPSRGIDAEAVTVTGGGAMERLFVEEGAKVHLFSRRGVFGWRTFADLVTLFQTEKPDIVHTHLFLADTWGRIAAWIARVPIIISTEHNVNETYRTIHRVTNRVLSIGTTAHIAVSKDVRRHLVEDDGIRPKKITVIENGIDLDAVIARGARPFCDIPKLIAVGRLNDQKDYPTLFKALALVKRPWRLSIIGTGPRERSLRQLADRLHIASRIVWLGYREDVAELLAASDLFCFPSSYEGLGLAAIEAAATGIPVVASDLPALHEVFGPDDATFVSVGDVPGFAHAIDRMLEHPSVAIMAAQRAVPHIRATFSIDRMVDRYAELYRKIFKSQLSISKRFGMNH